MTATQPADSARISLLVGAMTTGVSVHFYRYREPSRIAGTYP
ncbi:hypothetical protein Syncc8109_1203 [Synechococcus sp. WH 8109]|nr:hypothetical protein Syncc8109_1203 [Synechococcus sp. WH 8109]